MSKSTNHQKIYWLIWTLVIINLTSNLGLLGVMWHSLNDLKTKNRYIASNKEHFNHHMKIISEYSQSLSKNLLHLVNEHQVNVPPIAFDARSFDEINAMLEHNHGDEINHQLLIIKNHIMNFKSEWDHFLNWRVRYNLLSQDIQNQISLTDVQTRLNAMIEDVIYIEGVNRIEAARLIKLSRPSGSTDATQPPAPEFRDSLIKLADTTYHQIATQLSGMAIQIQAIKSEPSTGNLILLKDNELKQSYDHLVELISRVETLESNPENISTKYLQDIMESVFGVGFTIDQVEQSIIPGQGGLYNVFDEYLKLLDDHKIMTRNITQSLLTITQAVDSIKKTIFDQLSELDGTQEQAIQKSLYRLGFLVFIICLLLLAISYRIYLFIRKQIRLTESAFEEALNKKEYAELITRVVPSAVFTVDKDQRITSWNTKCAEITGFSPEEVLGHPCEVFALAPCSTKCGLYAADTGKPIMGRSCTVKTRDGRILDVLKNADLLKNNSGEIIGGVESFVDVTEDKKNQAALERANRELSESQKSLTLMMEEMKTTHEDLKRTQSQLIQVEKLSSLGLLAAGVAHEINNPLGFISNNIHILEEYIESYTQILKAMDNLTETIARQDWPSAAIEAQNLKQIKEELNLDYIRDDIIKLINQSKDGLERIQKIVLDLRTFAHTDTTEIEISNIENIIDKILNIVWHELKYKITLKKQYAGLPLIPCNAQKLGQVFINLFVNAAQAIETRGELTITTAIDGPWISVKVSDTGTGIPQAALNKIFDPFFTTKEIGKGTGLGLSVVYDIIKQHNGQIEVDSKLGHGTTFSIKLPIASQKIQEG